VKRVQKGTCKRIQRSQRLDRTGPQSGPHFGLAGPGSYRWTRSGSCQFTTCRTKERRAISLGAPHCRRPQEVLPSRCPPRTSGGGLQRCSRDGCGHARLRRAFIHDRCPYRTEECIGTERRPGADRQTQAREDDLKRTEAEAGKPRSPEACRHHRRLEEARQGPPPGSAEGARPR